MYVIHDQLESLFLLLLHQFCPGVLRLNLALLLVFLLLHLLYHLIKMPQCQLLILQLQVLQFLKLVKRFLSIRFIKDVSVCLVLTVILTVQVVNINYNVSNYVNFKNVFPTILYHNGEIISPPLFPWLIYVPNILYLLSRPS